MVSTKVKIKNSRGIHVRPAGLIVASVQSYDGKIDIISSAGKHASAQSILSLLALGLAPGDEVTLQVEGPDEEKVCAELAALFVRKFDFPVS